MKKLEKDLLEIKVYDTRSEMGEAAAREAAAYIRDLLQRQPEANIVFAAAPSQNDFLAALSRCDLPWGRINAYHMDEYIGLEKEAPQRFGNYLYDHIFSLVPLKSVHYLFKEGTDAEQVCRAYEAALGACRIDIIFMGVGENGHIAFNDPHVAFFDDPLGVKIVELDATCRKQQVHDGCFARLEEVPTHAITLTIPMMMRADRIFTIVPTALKAEAIRRIVEGGIEPACPASILRRHKAATLYCDADSAKYICQPEKTTTA